MSTQNNIPKTPIAFLRFVSKPYKKLAVISTIAVIFAAAITTFDAYILRKIIDTLSSTPEQTSVLFWVILYPVSILVGSMMWRLSGIFGSQWVIGVETSGYKKLFDYMSRHSQSYFDNQFAGSLVGSINTASSGAATIIEMYLWRYLETFIGFIVSITLVATTNTTVALIFGAWIVFLIPVNFFLAKKKKVYSEQEAQAQIELRGKAVDSTTNMSVVQQFAQRPFEVSRLGQAITNYGTTYQKSWYFSEGMLALNNILLTLFVATTLLPAFFIWQSGGMTIGELIMIITLMAGLLHSFTFIGNSMNYFAKNYGEVTKGLSDILKPHAITDIPQARKLDVTDGAIRFENVTFQYNERQSVLETLTLDIKPGQRVGIVGPSGAGKTTLIRLLLRQHEIEQGEITIDRQDISRVTLDSLRSSIGIVPQEPLLFHRSIKENILYGKPDATDQEIIEAAKLAQAHGFIEQFPDTYNTLVGERGVKLSAGQRQRIAIARAILKNAPILILDEATSALDSESEVAIQKALETLMEGKTVLAIAHRLSTLAEMDRIIVLKDGAVIEDDTHEELIQRDNGVYAKLWQHQAGGFLVDEA